MDTLTTRLQRLPTAAQRIGSGLAVRGLRGPSALLDPFISADHFQMSAPTFPPHPHAGFSAVTYLFEDSATGFLNRDSLGNEGPIAPGELHWTLAGSGVMHEEFPLETGQVAHGLQIFVNLPRAQKQRAPEALHLAAPLMLRRSGPGWQLIEVFGGEAPLALPVQASLRVVQLEPNANFEMTLDDEEQGFALVIDGRGRAGGEALEAGEAFVVEPGLLLHASSALRVAFFAGRPLREPVVQHGPFVMSSEAEVVQALRRHQAGQMGRLAPRGAA